MKTSWLLLPLGLACLTLSTTRTTTAQEASQTPARRLLVDCQIGKAVLLANTEQPQAGLAVAWTLRPNRQQAAVDWTLYDDENKSWNLLQRFPVDHVAPANGDYLLVTGVLDLKTKGFTPLPSRDAYYPTKNHASLTAAWSDEAHGTRYGAIANNAGGHYFERTLELWLVQIDAQETRFSELTPAADKAVRAYLRRRDRKNAAHYVWEYDFPDTAFQGKKLAVHFAAMIPDRDDGDDGVVHFALPGGRVTGTTKQ